jgi:hypothetical protein
VCVSFNSVVCSQDVLLVRHKAGGSQTTAWLAAPAPKWYQSMSCCCSCSPNSPCRRDSDETYVLNGKLLSALTSSGLAVDAGHRNLTCCVTLHWHTPRTEPLRRHMLC